MPISLCECGAGITFYATGASNVSNKGSREYATCLSCGKRWTAWFDEFGNEVERRETRKAPIDKKYKRQPGGFVQTLCWRCDNARGNGCSWFRFYKPIEGWEAIPAVVDDNETYTVLSCPEFKPDRGEYMGDDADDF